MCLSCLHNAVCDTEQGCDDPDHGTLVGLAAACPPAPDTLAETAGLIREWYGLCGPFSSGGPLHIQLDDDNLDDRWLTDATYDRGWEHYEELRTPERYAAGMRILELLRPMTKAEREMTVNAAHHAEFSHLLGVEVRGTTPY
jgi:hypothetical protein